MTDSASAGGSRHKVQVTPVDSAEVDDFTDLHPKDIPRSPTQLAANIWTGSTYDNLTDALAALLETGFAVLDSPPAMLRARGQDVDDAIFNASWLMTAPTAQDTTTIPYTDWLPGNTNHAFAKYVHGLIQTGGAFQRRGEPYEGVLSIGGVRRRNLAHLGPQANLLFPHQDECKLSVLMAEFAAHGDGGDPLVGLDTVAPAVAECLSGAFRGGQVEQGAERPAAITCRQVNFWVPHEPDGDKYLVFLSRAASEALVSQGQGFITAGQLPRWSSRGADHKALVVNRNFQLTDRAVAYVERHMPEHVLLVNKPVIFVSHWSRIGDGRELGQRADAAQGIFHCGAALEGKGHCSSEMRLALFSSPPDAASPRHAL